MAPKTTAPAEDDACLGLIEIRATKNGDHIKVNGAYTDRLQHGAYVAIQLLNLFVDKIAESGNPGSSYSGPVETDFPHKKRQLAPSLREETTDLAPLESPPPRRRKK